MQLFTVIVCPLINIEIENEIDIFISIQTELPLTWFFRRSCKNWLLCRAVFKWLSKVITWLRLLCLVIGLRDSRELFNQWQAKPNPIAPCTRDFSRASSELQVIARNCDWFMALFVPVVIGRSNCFGCGFSTVIWKPLYNTSGIKHFHPHEQVWH